VTGVVGRRELDHAGGVERASVRHRAARRTVPVGGSNRLLSVEELAAYLGVPKKTVYGCWRQWGLRGYRVGRYLRFRERHVEEWLQTRGGMTVAKIFKRCPCPEGQWGTCPHQWVVRYRTTGGRSSRQHEQSFGTDLREAEDFALKVEHDKRAHVFVDPKAGRVLFRDAAGTWLDQHLGADSWRAGRHGSPV
jgi:excisionase family DNA binding protein